MDAANQKDGSSRNTDQQQNPGQQRNVLWKTQAGRPDNYTGPHFLQRLVLNADVQPRSYWAVVSDAQAISLQVSIVASVLEVHSLLLTESVGVQSVLLLVLALICFGQVFVRLFTGRQLGGNVLRAARQSFLLIVGVYCLSPLYATLAKAISGDTVVAASAWLLAVHLYIHDYFFKISVAYKLTGSLSMVAAVAASLLLASRLGSPQRVVCFSMKIDQIQTRDYCVNSALCRCASDVHCHMIAMGLKGCAHPGMLCLHVLLLAGVCFLLWLTRAVRHLIGSTDTLLVVQFAQILFSLTAFVLLPFTCQHIKQQSHRLFTAVVVVALVATCMLLGTYSWKMMCAYVALHVHLVFVCPWWLLQIEKFKSKINGPWDEAVPKLTKLVRESSFSSSSGEDTNTLHLRKCS